jgi:hypothetical protein
MRNARGIVAAAIPGCATALVVAALASGGSRGTALVELQVAPRGPGTVSAVPAGVDLENDKQPVTQPCFDNEGDDSCLWGYPPGTRITLTAKADSGKSFSGWSSPECPGTGSCTIALDEDPMSVVAQFSPLRLGIRLSDKNAGKVTTDPAGKPCQEDLKDQCFEFPPNTTVRVTVQETGGVFKEWNPGCEPRNQKTCTVRVDDDPTWVGARFDNDDPPQLPSTISVQFQIRRGGNGSGRVTAPKLDCGTICTAQYGFGNSITLTAKEDEGSTFDGWNGVCAKTQKTCSFPVGPITSIRALFARDTTAPTAPGALAVRSRTRTSIAIAWTPATDNVGVARYRIYVDGAAAGDTAATDFTLDGLKCGRSYDIGVDASDAVGNRSQRANVSVQTLACALAARLAGVSVQRAGGTRVVTVQLRVNRPTTVRLTLLRNGKKTTSGRFTAKPGTNALKLRVPKTIPGGQYRVSISVVNPDGGTLVFGRGVLLPRP